MPLQEICASKVHRKMCLIFSIVEKYYVIYSVADPGRYLTDPDPDPDPSEI